MEYFCGRRVRYITPFRLMFVLCLLAFFVFHLEIDQSATKLPANGRPLVSVGNRAIETANSPAEVRKALQEQPADLQRARETGVLPQNVREQIHTSSQDLRRKASRRLVELGAAPLPAASVAAPSRRRAGTRRVQISWLPRRGSTRG